MNRKEDVDAFLKQNTIALVGASRDKWAFSNVVLRELRERGYRVFPVNPNAEKIGEEKCYPNLDAIPEKVGGALFLTPPKATEGAVREAIGSGVEHLWIQRGAESKAALDFCRENSSKVVSGECIMMFAEPVKSFHAFHRWVWKILGKLPR